MTKDSVETVFFLAHLFLILYRTICNFIFLGFAAHRTYNYVFERIFINYIQEALAAGDNIVVQQNMPNAQLGNIVLIVGYDPEKGFKIKNSHPIGEDGGKIEWIPVNRMTWYQYIVTEENYEVIKFFDGEVHKQNRNAVIKLLGTAHLHSVTQKDHAWTFFGEQSPSKHLINEAEIFEIQYPNTTKYFQ